MGVLKMQEENILRKKRSNFIKIVQDAAAELGCVFFFEWGSGKEIETDDLRAWDSFGWLIPLENRDAFALLLKNDDTDDWDDFWVNESFTINEVTGKCEVEFEKLEIFDIA